LLRLVGAKINLGNLLFEEKDMEDAIYFSGAQGNLRLAEGFAHRKASGVKLDSAINIGFTQDITGFIFNQGEVSSKDA
jgi:hypothetical protein